MPTDAAKCLNSLKCEQTFHKSVAFDRKIERPLFNATRNTHLLPLFVYSSPNRSDRKCLLPTQGVNKKCNYHTVYQLEYIISLLFLF